jgi:hypothetical protein
LVLTLPSSPYGLAGLLVTAITTPRRILPETLTNTIHSLNVVRPGSVINNRVPASSLSLRMDHALPPKLLFNKVPINFHHKSTSKVVLCIQVKFHKR